jgi:hypothetical protein
VLLSQERLPQPKDGLLRLGGARPTRWQVLEWIDPDA